MRVVASFTNHPCAPNTNPSTHPTKVRLEFLRALGDWMLRLRERSDHEGRLLPFVLAGLVDESPAVAAESVQLLEALGEQYEREHEQEVKELLLYCPEEEAGGACDNEASQEASSLDDSSRALEAVTASLRLGARLLVQGNAGRLLAPLCAELSGWQAGTRVR